MAEKETLEEVKKQLVNSLGLAMEAQSHQFHSLAGLLMDKGVFSRDELVEYMERLNVDTGEGTNPFVESLINGLHNSTFGD